MIISLPLPDKGLSPNARVHWRPKAVLVRAAREYAFWVAMQAMKQSMDTLDGKASVTVTIHYPDRRRRDLDNLIAACKSYQDGIADAIKVPDHQWHVTYRKGEVIKGGRVIYEVTP